MNLISTLSKTVYCFLIKIVHCFLHKLFLALRIKLFSVQHYLKNCSLSFLHKLFSIHYFLIKQLVKLCFLNLNSKSECFFVFEFHNNQIYFSALIKSISTLIKFAQSERYSNIYIYIQIDRIMVKFAKFLNSSHPDHHGYSYTTTQ